MNDSVPESTSRRGRFIDRIYYLGVILKGVDGAVEFLAGFVLLFAPHLPHTLLTSLSAEAGEGRTPLRIFLANYIESLDDRLASAGLYFLVAYLILHGAIKLVLVYCLLRRIHAAYPWAIAILLAFLAYQVYTTIVSPSILLVLLDLLDAAIIVLIYLEYRRIVPKHQPAEAVEVEPA
jgi:uncharacterized membrane protein